MNDEETAESENAWSEQVADGNRFEFGKNWQRFLGAIDSERINKAEESFGRMLDLNLLRDRKFVDAGSGSGLSSLIARRAGADVVSFDFDPESVACTKALRQKYRHDDENWQVFEGSVLDPEFVASLGTFDVVYSWGVLHHTGAMWRALENSVHMVNRDGFLFIALYNDQGGKSAFWTMLKRFYCGSFAGKCLAVTIGFPLLSLNPLISSIYTRRNLFKCYSKKRGMSVYHDWHDWLGGYPFEVAQPEEVLSFVRAFGFELVALATTNGHGTNQFVFQRTSKHDLEDA